MGSPITSELSIGSEIIISPVPGISLGEVQHPEAASGANIVRPTAPEQMDSEQLARYVMNNGWGDVLLKLTELNRPIMVLWGRFDALKKRETIAGCRTKTEFCEKCLHRSIRAVQYMLYGRTPKKPNHSRPGRPAKEVEQLRLPASSNATTPAGESGASAGEEEPLLPLLVPGAGEPEIRKFSVTINRIRIQKCCTTVTVEAATPEEAQKRVSEMMTADCPEQTDWHEVEDTIQYVPTSPEELSPSDSSVSPKEDSLSTAEPDYAVNSSGSSVEVTSPSDTAVSVPTPEDTVTPLAEGQPEQENEKAAKPQRRAVRSFTVDERTAQKGWTCKYNGMDYEIADVFDDGNASLLRKSDGESFDPVPVRELRYILDPKAV